MKKTKLVEQKIGRRKIFPALRKMRQLALLLWPHTQNHKGLLVVGATISMVLIGLRLAQPWPLKWIIDILSENNSLPVWLKLPPEHAIALLSFSYIGVSLLAGLADYWQTILLSGLGNRIIYSFRNKAFDHLFRLPVSFHEKRTVGELVTRIVYDTSRLDGPSSYLVARNHVVAGQEDGALAIQFVQNAWFPDEIPPSPSYLTITQNELQSGSDGVVLQDSVYWNLGLATLHAEVSENDIFLNESPWGAIQLLGGQGTRITDNRIYGKAWTGIYMGIFPEDGERVVGVLIKNNNLSNLEAEVAQVWLGGGTSNSMVIGGRYKPDVLDQGTNNILAGVNLLPGEMSAMGLSQASGLQGYSSKLFTPEMMQWMEMLMRRHR